jgi:ubiquitin-conjugating enzyme E2 M
MLKLAEAQKKKKKEAEDAAAANPSAAAAPVVVSSSAPKGPGLSAAELRIQKDISSLDNFGGVVSIPSLNSRDFSLLRFEVNVVPTKGLWAGCTYVFVFEIPEEFPMQEPKVTCKTKIYHPNIDFQGKVCLGELVKTGWRPTTTLNELFVQLAIVLFEEPNPSDPLNLAAAERMRNNYAEFVHDVERTLRGGHYFGQVFEALKRR